MEKQTRRKFMATGSMAAVGVALPQLASAKSAEALVHHVFFWLKNPSSSDDLKKLLEGIGTLRQINSLRLVKIGVPASTEDRDVIDNTYSVSLLTFFDDTKGHDEYQVHPIHKKFVENYSHLWQKVVVYDSIDVK
jgi:hypothetical protein